MCKKYGKEKFIMGVGISSADYPQWKSSFVDKIKNPKVSKVQEADNSILSDNCTDGKDDGKIGFFNAVGHVIKGAGNTLVDTVKGCFTDENGDLSIGKTLLTVGATAACIAFPPLGLAACAVGATVGAVKAGQGIYNAATAKTDAEAKKAWQEVGGGAITAGASAVGAKSSIGAVKATSTAGTKGGSALSELDEAASIAEKASALGKDALSSTKNRLTSIKDKVVDLKQVHSEVKQIEQMRKANAQALEKQAKGEALSAEETKAISDWENIADKGFSDKALAQVSKNNAKSFWEAELKEAKELGDKDLIAAVQKELEPYTISGKLKNGASSIVDNLSGTIKNSNTIKASNSLTNGVKDTAGLINKAKLLKSNLTKENLSGICKGLSSDGQAILSALTKSNPESVIQKYGYENVAAVLETVSGYTVATQAV